MTDLQPADAEAVARDIDFCLEFGDVPTARMQLACLIELLPRIGGQMQATEALLEATQEQLSQFVRDFCALRDALPRERAAQILGIPDNPKEEQ